MESSRNPRPAPARRSPRHRHGRPPYPVPRRPPEPLPLPRGRPPFAGCPAPASGARRSAPTRRAGRLAVVTSDPRLSRRLEQRLGRPPDPDGELAGVCTGPAVAPGRCHPSSETSRLQSAVGSSSTPVGKRVGEDAVGLRQGGRSAGRSRFGRQEGGHCRQTGIGDPTQRRWSPCPGSWVHPIPNALGTAGSVRLTSVGTRTALDRNHRGSGPA